MSLGTTSPPNQAGRHLGSVAQFLNDRYTCNPFGCGAGATGVVSSWRSMPALRQLWRGGILQCPHLIRATDSGGAATTEVGEAGGPAPALAGVGRSLQLHVPHPQCSHR